MQVFLSKHFSIHLSQSFKIKSTQALAPESPDFSLNSRELKGFLAWNKQLSTFQDQVPQRAPNVFISIYYNSMSSGVIMAVL